MGVLPPALALTRKPVPGVLKTAPRGEFTLKKLAGSAFGSEKHSGTPSQLISRRKPPNEPFAPATVPPPTDARNASRVAVIAAGFAPAASKTVKFAKAAGLRSKPIAVPRTMEKSLLCIMTSTKSC